MDPVNRYVRNKRRGNAYHATMNLLWHLGTPPTLGRNRMIFNQEALNRAVARILHNRAAKHTAALVLLRPKLNKNVRIVIAKYL